MPLGLLAEEARLIAERENARLITEGVILQAAAASIMSKEGGEHFTKLLKQLSEN